ncbi:MAG: winged helix-turn-helix transcriptional regulator [Propionibacteriaceae bacterium]|jgi:hypothetical protein|nr:winged helix-turn-helix transcriptional regulator [Propionibacteriaceae bacterium]
MEATVNESLKRANQAKQELVSAQSEIETRLVAVQSDLNKINSEFARLTAERKALLHVAADSGISVTRLARLLGISQPLVSRALGKNSAASGRGRKRSSQA